MALLKLIALIACSSFSAHAAQLKFSSSSAESDRPVSSLFEGREVKFTQAKRNLKISFVFEKPVSISELKLESCAGDWADGIQIFTSPLLARAFSEGGTSTIDQKLNVKDVRSLSLVFGRDVNVCLKKLSLFDEKHAAISVETPRLVETTISPAEAGLLFDGHSETVMSLQAPVKLSFQTPQSFDRAFISTARSQRYAHAITLTGDHGWREKLPLRFASAEQEVLFRIPFNGKTLTLAADDQGDVSEIRFGHGTKVGVIQAAKPELASFANLFDSSWSTASTSGDHWTFLFRSDGTFFVKGENDDPKQPRDYSALGAFTVTHQSETELSVKIHGVRVATPLKWDGVICPYACGNEGPVETPLADTLVFEKGTDGSMMIRNRTPRAERTLTFGDLKVQRSSE